MELGNRLRRDLKDLFGDLKAVPGPEEANVHEDQVRLVILGQAQGFFGGLGDGADMVPVFRKGGFQPPADEHLVLHDQDLQDLE